MKHLALSIIISLAAPLGAQDSKEKEPAPAAETAASAPDMTALSQAAADFVLAYNNKDAKALAELFTEAGEMSDLMGEEIVSGRAAIQAHYEEIFAGEDVPAMAVEVDSVRLVAPNLAIEDGTVHLTPPEKDAPPRSTTYTATLLRNEAGVWQIASTRDLGDATDAAGQLADLAKVISGDWTCRNAAGARVDLAFGWDSSGKFLSGEMLTTAAGAEPQEGTIRIGWNAARSSIVSWIFDADGGVLQSVWTPVDDGWLLRSEGTTADGETITSSQELTAEDRNTLLWSATNRVIDGEKQPDNVMRIVRQAPEPSSASN